MSIFMSDDCEASAGVDGDAIEGDTTEECQVVEEQLQDRIDQIMEAEEEGAGAFIQMNEEHRFGRFMTGVGLSFLMLFLLFACVGTAVVIMSLSGCCC